MAKDKKTIKYEADIAGFNKNIESARKAVKTLNNELKLNQTQLKGNRNSVELLGQKLELLKQQHEEQTKIVENTRKKYEEAVEVYGENSKAAESLKDKLIEAETKQQSIANAIKTTNEQLSIQSNKFINAGKSMTEFGEKINTVGDKVDSVGSKLSVISAGVGAIAVASTTASIKFESAWTGVEKTVDGTEEQLRNLRQDILEMSTQLPSTAEEIASVAESAGQLGIKTDNIKEFSKTMINLGNATNMTADEAATQLARLINITGMSQEEFDKLGSTIVDLGNNLATTESEITSMALELAGAGSQVGMSEAQILSFAGALSSVGIEADAGGSAFSKVMIQMQLAVEKGGDSLKDFAKVSGMTSEEFKKAFKEDASSAIIEFIKGLSNCESKGTTAIKVLDDMGITEVRLRDSLLRASGASEVFTNALQIGTNAWNENIALSNEANKRYETTESKLQMLKNEIVANGIALGDELKPALIEVLEQAKPIISNITSMVKSFNKLDSATKKNIISLGVMVVATGPAVKIGGKLISTLGNGVKTVGMFSQAIGFMGKTSTEAFKNASSGVQTLTGALTFMTSPMGLATIAVTAIAGTMAYFALKESEAQKEAKEFANAMAESKQELEDYNKSIDETTNANLAHINSASSLKNELAQLVDENGKVKEGYEGRVSFILNELNEALGTEYKLNKDIIDNYKDLQEEIDKTIEKKKAEIYLNADEEKYKNAIENQKEAIEELKQAHEKLGRFNRRCKEKER